MASQAQSKSIQVVWGQNITRSDIRRWQRRGHRWRNGLVLHQNVDAANGDARALRLGSEWQAFHLCRRRWNARDQQGWPCLVTRQQFRSPMLYIGHADVGQWRRRDFLFNRRPKCYS
jgi:hypothetical protein